MRPVDIEGPEALPFLQHLLANDAGKLSVIGKALYSCMLNPQGGVIDDLILYFRGPERYRAVVNAATADKDCDWMQRQAAGRAVRIGRRDDLAMVAVQGPEARAQVAALLPDPLRQPAMQLEPFHAAEHADWFVGRTGYTGEDGFEVMLPSDAAAGFWRGAVTAGVRPCGLGARDTLRLEAGMNLYGQDMDETIGPLDAGLGWTVAWKPDGRDFIGRTALETRRDDPERRDFVGLLLTGRGILRPHQRVMVDNRDVGEVTSGGFSPTLERSIAFARIAPDSPIECAVEIRGKAVPARIVKPPFVRYGKPRVNL
jgi:aminomethyltransferase